MTLARSQQVSLDDTPYYHCISRCVRRAYLCGKDPVSGRDFDHRKAWLVERIKFLASCFAVDVCAYAVMSNHYHLVLHVDQQRAASWTDEELVERWTAVFPANGAIVKTLMKNASSKTAQRRLEKQLRLWRSRLTDLSWFMRCLNEPVARRANREDECTGRFWEGRFKCQALLDEKSLVTCMAYVDLNPVRAGQSDSLDNSDFTSIQERLIDHAKKVKTRNYRQHRLLTRKNASHLLDQRAGVRKAPLMPLLASVARTCGAQSGAGLPMARDSYVKLLDSTVRAIGEGKGNQFAARRALEQSRATFDMLGLAPDGWFKSVTEFEKHYGLAAGSKEKLEMWQKQRIANGGEVKFPHKWIRGIRAASRFLTPESTSSPPG